MEGRFQNQQLTLRLFILVDFGWVHVLAVLVVVTGAEPSQLLMLRLGVEFDSFENDNLNQIL